MSLIPQLLPVEISYDKQKNIILGNIVKMLIERGVVRKDFQSTFSNVLSNLKDDDTCDIIVDNPRNDDSSVYHIILLLDQKVSTITKSSVIGEYIYKTTSEHKIIITNDITPRARLSIQNNFPLVEIFLKKEMMFNLIESIYVPRHIILTQEDADRVLSEYGLQKKDLPRIFVSDPMSRYYNAKLGQIFRIIRPSETSGSSNYYRIVVRESFTKKSK
jgi:DNA-directed RNA polymerases I, II, and III subunit RPABC1